MLNHKDKEEFPSKNWGTHITKCVIYYCEFLNSEYIILFYKITFKFKNK